MPIDFDKIKAPKNFDRELEEMKSVRTTFRLSKQGLESLNYLAETLSIKKKDVFDYTGKSLLEKEIGNKTGKTAIDLFMEDLDKKGIEYKGSPIRKTQVVSLGTKRLLDRTAKKYRVKRDHLVNFLLCVSAMIHKDSREKRIEKLDYFSGKLNTLRNMALELEGEAEEKLSNTAFLSRIGIIVVIIDNLMMAVDSYIKDGIPIDPDNFSQSG